ncbi:MAG: hypothetical protein AAFX99_10285 [Myxococcota bacterium]
MTTSSLSTTIPVTTPNDPHHLTSLRIALGVLAWWTIAWSAVALGLLEQALPPLIPLLIMGPVVVNIVLFARSPQLRRWLAKTDERWLLLIHLVRIPFGVSFLWHLSQGTPGIPELFAVRAGYGDIAAGVLAALLLLPIDLGNLRQRLGLPLFSIVGLGDMMLVVATAQWFLFTEGFDAMGLMRQHPFHMLPVFIVPMILTCHLLLIAKLMGVGQPNTTTSSKS